MWLSVPPASLSHPGARDGSPRQWLRRPPDPAPEQSHTPSPGLTPRPAGRQEKGPSGGDVTSRTWPSATFTGPWLSRVLLPRGLLLLQPGGRGGECPSPNHQGPESGALLPGSRAGGCRPDLLPLPARQLWQGLRGTLAPPDGKNQPRPGLGSMERQRRNNKEKSTHFQSFHTQ